MRWVLFQLNKNHGYRRNSCHSFWEIIFLRGLAESPNTLGAQNHFDLASILEDRNPLQIGAERSVGRPQREAAIMSKSCRLTTLFTFSHRQKFLSKTVFHQPGNRSSRCREDEFYHNPKLFTRMTVNNKGE